MGWSTELQQASFRGITFECISTTDSFNKSLAVHQSPYSNDAEIEDVGVDPNKIGLKIFLSGDNYLEYLNALITAFVATGEGELIHPIHGIKNVQALSWNVNHDTETVDGCIVDAEFLVAKAEKKQLFVPVAYIDTASVLEIPATSFKKELEILKSLNPNKFFTVVNNIQNGLKKARQILGTIRSTVDNILSPKKWATDLVNDVVSLVTFDLTDISALSKWRTIADRIKRISKTFDDDESSSGTLKQLWRAVTVSASVAVVKEILSKTRSEIVSDNTSSMSPIELAIIRQHVRKEIQHVIDEERASITATLSDNNQSLQIAEYKKIALTVFDQVQELIETRPPITTVKIEQVCTAHWLAHKLYGDYTRAIEIKRLNPSIVNFAVLQAGMEITCYAR